MKKPDAMQISISDEKGMIVGELSYRLIDDYSSDLAQLINSIKPGEYNIVIYHYEEIKE